jgi:glycosyltransferase involved in cell wall biosynthesis
MHALAAKPGDHWAEGRSTRLVIVAPWGERDGGAEVMLGGLLRQLQRSCADMHVVFLQAGPFERETASLGLRTHVVQAVRLRNIAQTCRAIWRLGALLRNLEPDLVLSWAPKAHVYVAAAALLTRRQPRLAWWQHGITAGHWLDRLATRLPAAAIGCSSQAAAAAQTLLRPRRPLFVVHPGVDTRCEEPGSRAAIRCALGVPEHTFVAGVVGRLQPDKGQDIFLRAVAELRARGRQVHGLVVGGAAFGLSPAYPESLRRLVSELGLESSVTFTGQVDDVPSYLSAMDVFVSPSATESFGIAILEAMTLGIVVVNGARGGPEEIIEGGVSGIMLDSRDPVEVAAAIEALMLDQLLRARLAKEARARASSFTTAAMTRRLEASLAQILG